MDSLDGGRFVYRVNGALGAYGDWGDYADILIHGWCDNRLIKSDDPPPLELYRVGTFVPEVFAVFHGLVSREKAKTTIESWGLLGLRFRPVTKTRIVQLKWRHWEPTGEPVYPRECEPENYILGRKHNQKLSDQIGEMWSITPDYRATLDDIIYGRADMADVCMISERFRQLLIHNDLSEWLEFVPLAIPRALPSEDAGH